jgi:hypothetical protein
LDRELQQISSVNAISTTKGGGHIKYIVDLMAKRLRAIVKKRNKGEAETKTNQIKNHLAIFVNSLVGNPTFNGQTKENMTIKPSTFVSVKLSGKFVKSIKKSGVANSIMSYAKFKQNQALKCMGSTKKTKLTSITKIEDVNNVGSARSKDCTLIITEGNSREGRRAKQKLDKIESSKMQAVVRHMPCLDPLSRLLPVKYLTRLSSSTTTNANAPSARSTMRIIDNDSKKKRPTDRTGLRYPLHWKRKLPFCLVLICFIILNRV